MAHGSGQQPDITPREVIECRGDPRAMGFAQGRSCRPAVRARVVHAGAATRKRVLRALLPLTTGRVLGRGMGREVIRHYPHLSERIQGLARGADLPFEALMELFVRAVSGAAADRALSAEAAVAVGSTGERGGLVVARALSGSGVPGSAWILRHSRPEVGFASHEVTLPWLASAVAGVNEGLCRLVQQAPRLRPRQHRRGRCLGECAGPGDRGWRAQGRAARAGCVAGRRKRGASQPASQRARRSW